MTSMNNSATRKTGVELMLIVGIIALWLVAIAIIVLFNKGAGEK